MHFHLPRADGTDIDCVDVRVGDLVVVIDGVEVVVAGVDLYLRLGRQLADDRVKDAWAGVKRGALADERVEHRQFADRFVASEAPIALRGALERVALGPTGHAVAILYANPRTAVFEHDDLLTICRRRHYGRIGGWLRSEANAERKNGKCLRGRRRRAGSFSAAHDEQRHQREKHHAEDDDDGEATRVAGLSVRHGVFPSFRAATTARNPLPMCAGGREISRRLRGSKGHGHFFINTYMIAFCTCSRFSASS